MPNLLPGTAAQVMGRMPQIGNKSIRFIYPLTRILFDAYFTMQIARGGGALWTVDRAKRLRWPRVGPLPF
jgi:hypothetical protein